jgi:hypothetical protein
MKNKGGAPKGSNNSSRGKLWTAAMKKVIASKGKDAKGVSIGLFNLANKMYDMGMEGDISAQKEFLDRFVGKVSQKVETEHTQYVVQIGGQDVDFTPVEKAKEEVRH